MSRPRTIALTTALALLCVPLIAAGILVPAALGALGEAASDSAPERPGTVVTVPAPTEVAAPATAGSGGADPRTTHRDLPAAVEAESVTPPALPLAPGWPTPARTVLAGSADLSPIPAGRGPPWATS